MEFGNPRTESEWYAAYAEWLVVTEAKMVEWTNALNIFASASVDYNQRWAIDTLDELLGRASANMRRMQFDHTFAWKPQWTLTGFKWLEPCLVLRRSGPI